MRLALGLLTFTTLVSAAEVSLLRRDTFDIGNRKSTCEVTLDGSKLRFDAVKNIGGKFEVAQSQTLEVTEGLLKTVETVLSQKATRRTTFAPNPSRSVYFLIDSARKTWVPFFENRPGQDIYVDSEDAYALRNLVDSYCR